MSASVDSKMNCLLCSGTGKRVELVVVTCEHDNIGNASPGSIDLLRRIQSGETLMESDIEKVQYLLSESRNVLKKGIVVFAIGVLLCILSIALAVFI